MMTLSELSIMGAVLIGLVVLLRYLAKDRLSPQCYLVLWLAVGIRLLLPIQVYSPFSLYGLFDYAEAERFALAPLSISAGIYQPDGTIPSYVAGGGSVDWPVVLWLGVAGCIFLLTAVWHWQNRKVYRTSLPVEHVRVMAWQQNHKLYRRYQIRQSRQIDAPLTYGVICPVILLPADLDLDDTAVDLMLLHEWQHIRHLDIFWQWLLVLLCSVYWFHPAVWLMSALCRQDLELWCDCAAVHTMNRDERKLYAMLLLEQVHNASRMPLFSQFCFTGYSRMEERVKVIMKGKSATGKMMLATAVLLCAGGVCFAASASDVNHADKWIAVGASDIQRDAVTELVWPVPADGAQLTLNYGVREHPVTGMEMKIDHICIGGVENGSDIIAAASGIVKEAGYDAKRGNYLIVECADGLETHYWHCERLLVKEGDDVSVYDTIAALGQTGDATGPCLSFSVYQNGEACDPMQWLQ